MKTKQIAIALAAAGALAGLWFGRLAWRAHHNLVTLHTRNMPLAEVVRSLERQTWEKIIFDNKLAGRITLNVKDAPLAGVLDLVADEAGARWQETFAVGASDSAMARLESVLEGAAKLGAAGWTNLAPQFPAEALRILPEAGPEPDAGKPGGVRRKILLNDDTAPGGAPGGKGGGAKMLTFLPDGTIDQWSSQRLVLEINLLPQLGTALPSEATTETAAHTASAVHGQWRMYYALEQAPFTMGGPLGARLAGGKRGGRKLMGGGDIGAAIAQERGQDRLRALSRSPEAQVEQARQQGESKMLLEDTEVTK